MTTPLPLAQWAARHSVAPAALADLLALMGAGEQAAPPVTAGPTKEGYVQSVVRLEAPKLGLTLWRNNSGALLDKDGRLVKFGLGNESSAINKVLKSSDLIGIGQNGEFIAAEIKKPGWTKPTNERELAQLNFIMLVNARGGRAAFISHPDQLKLLCAQ